MDTTVHFAYYDNREYAPDNTWGKGMYVHDAQNATGRTGVTIDRLAMAERANLRRSRGKL